MIAALHFRSRVARHLSRLSFATSIMILCAMFGAHADELYRAEYDISIIGLTIASANTETTVRNGVYNLNGNFATSGLARIFDETKGTVQVSGSSVRGKVVPSSFDLAYRHGRRDKRTTILFKDGNVISAENVPPTKKRDPWVEVTPQHLINVSDPLSALMLPVSNAGDVCNRNIEVFDGQTRAEIQFSFNGTESFTTDGFTGEAVICRAKFVPISGYQKGKKAIDYLSNKSRISVAFAPLGNSGIYAPVVARIGTQIGTLKIEATRFEKVK